MGLAGVDLGGHSVALGKEENKQHRECSMETMIQRAPKAHGGEIICSSWSMSLRHSIHGDTFLGTKMLHFLSPPLSINTAPPVGSSTVWTLAA